MKQIAFAAALLALPFTVLAQEAKPEKPVTPNDIVAAAKAEEWVAIAPEDLLIMDLSPDAKGRPRRVIIQLMPPPFSQGWVGNIRKLAAAHWWDGTAIVRVQDNYVVQWGDPNGEDTKKAKKLPGDLVVVPESDYVTNENYAGSEKLLNTHIYHRERVRKSILLKSGKRGDDYAEDTYFYRGWPLGWENTHQNGDAWPLHCYGMVGVGRDVSPNTGTGAELYTVIGHAPRQLDRNIALVGRVISGIENLTVLPRGTEALGFYKTAEERVPITSVRLASELPAAEQPQYEYLSTESESFARYVDKRANRKDDFYIRPAGGVDICNVPVPIRQKAAAK